MKYADTINRLASLYKKEGASPTPEQIERTKEAMTPEDVELCQLEQLRERGLKSLGLYKDLEEDLSILTEDAEATIEKYVNTDTYFNSYVTDRVESSYLDNVKSAIRRGEFSSAPTLAGSSERRKQVSEASTIFAECVATEYLRQIKNYVGSSRNRVLKALLPFVRIYLAKYLLKRRDAKLLKWELEKDSILSSLKESGYRSSAKNVTAKEWEILEEQLSELSYIVETYALWNVELDEEPSPSDKEYNYCDAASYYFSDVVRICREATGEAISSGSLASAIAKIREAYQLEAVQETLKLVASSKFKKYATMFNEAEASLQ